ncbi:MAG: glycosyl hydrolase [Lachnospiraceae bacterium]|jgi:hypothetical protein|nr:glycosyl hydrolase [Lachnospiraceae bacterium]
MRKRNARVLAGVLTAALAANSFGLFSPGAAAVEAASRSAIDTEEFATPGKTYQPGVRWWWSGGAVEKEELIRELEYLADQNIGYVEINPFGKIDVEEKDKEKLSSVYTPEFYELLDTAVTKAEELGITVDLNMGSGWNANSQFVKQEDSMGNMALGRATISAKEMNLASVAIPDVEKSSFYYGASQKGVWDDAKIKLQGVLVAERTGEKGEDFTPKFSWATGMTSAYNEFTTSQGTQTSKTYASQIEINAHNSVYVDASDMKGDTINLEGTGLTVTDGKEYEVIALYYLPSGAKGIDSAADWYVVDHMDGEKAAEYINQWLGEAYMNQILNRHGNIRALFNDSYEFYSDVYYTEDLYTLAKDSDNNGIGYDFSSYLPTIYKEYSAAPFYMGLGTADTFLTYTMDAGEKSRITYDYNTLVGAKFAEGMEGFQSAANDFGLLYRQEAYNPPIDTLASAKYVDIPEGEQGNEMSLIRVSSGAHLYDKNLVTCEQYTLGCTPFKNTLEQVKIGYDNMATSGVNNFFYHGFNYHYGVGSEIYGENGWSPMSGTGINVTEMNTLSPYFVDMNLYAARVNYMMQQGDASKDVALYMPFNGSLSETDGVKAMNYNGIAWDAINDDSIQADNTKYQGGKISVNGGNMEYDAILVETTSLPVATMEKLKAMAKAGANIIFYGEMPSSQPGFADGNYEKEDAKVAAISKEMAGLSSVSHADNMDTLESALTKAVDPKVSYERNENVRFARRTLSDGGELVYIRNISSEENTITVNADSKYENFYWLDQNTGKIYEAQDNNGTITFNMDAGTDTYSNKYSMALALLCEPEGAEVKASAITEGTPSSIDEVETEEKAELTVNSLTVTADNLDGVIGGEEKTVTFTENVLGKWNDESFHDGMLQTVVADGIYKTSYELPVGEKADKAVLKLNNVYTAASVKVNGKDAGNVMYAPYELDITSLLTEGTNDIEITVTPRKMNRYYNITDGQYSSKELIDTGMEGPVVLGITKSLTQAGKELADANAKLEAAKKELEKAKKDQEAALAAAKAEAEKAVKEAEAKVAAAEAKLAKVQFSNTKTSIKAVKSTKKKQVKVSWKKVSGADGYVIQYASNSKLKGAKKVTVKKGTATVQTIKRLKSRKKYTFRVRAYKMIDGKKVYAKYSGKKSVRVK